MLQSRIAATLCLVAIPPFLAAICPQTLPNRINAREISEQVTVLRAKQDMLHGTLFTLPGEYFEETTVAATNAPSGYIQSLEKLKNQMLDKTISRGDFLTLDCLSSTWARYLLPLARSGQTV